MKLIEPYMFVMVGGGVRWHICRAPSAGLQVDWHAHVLCGIRPVRSPFLNEASSGICKSCLRQYERTEAADAD